MFPSLFMARVDTALRGGVRGGGTCWNRAESAMPPALLTTSLVNTIQIGSLYALMALGITLTFSVMKLPNFAHAEYVTAGAYAALIVSLSGVLNPIVIMVAAFVVGALTALISHLAVFKPLEGRDVSFYTLILASFAVGLIIRYILFTMADYFNLFDLRIAIPLRVLFREGYLILSNLFAWVVPTSLVLVIILTLLLNRSPLGREMRALANNINLARVIGIPVERVKNYTWLLVGGLAGVAGALWGLQTAVHPLMGWGAIISVFAAAILGRLVELFRHHPRRLRGRLFGKYRHTLPQRQLRRRPRLQTGDTLHHHHRRLAVSPAGSHQADQARRRPGAMINIDIGATAISILTLFGIYSLMSISLNLEYGVAGLPNFGKALFISIGAYTAGITYTRLLPLLAGVEAIHPCGPTMGGALQLRSEIMASQPIAGFINFGLTLLFAAVIAGAVGFAVSYVTLRLKEEWFLALVLLVGGETVRILVRGADDFICSHNGISGVAQPFFFVRRSALTRPAFYAAFAGAGAAGLPLQPTAESLALRPHAEGLARK